MYVPALRDLEQAERWFRLSLNLRTEKDWDGRSTGLATLAALALERFDEAYDADEAEPVLLKYLNDALRGLQESLDLVPPGDHASRSVRENKLGDVYRRAGDTGKALRHYQRAIQHFEALGHIFGAGWVRYNVALLLADGDRTDEALHYARAALDNFQHAERGTAEAAMAEQLIANLEQPSR
jgi:tetratricopeptide (TPR) repeat protein